MRGVPSSTARLAGMYARSMGRTWDAGSGFWIGDGAGTVRMEQLRSRQPAKQLSLVIKLFCRDQDSSHRRVYRAYMLLLSLPTTTSSVRCPMASPRQCVCPARPCRRRPHNNNKVRDPSRGDVTPSPPIFHPISPSGQATPPPLQHTKHPCMGVAHATATPTRRQVCSIFARRCRLRTGSHAGANRRRRRGRAGKSRIQSPDLHNKIDYLSQECLTSVSQPVQSSSMQSVVSYFRAGGIACLSLPMPSPPPPTTHSFIALPSPAQPRSDARKGLAGSTLSGRGAPARQLAPSPGPIDSQGPRSR